LLDATDRATVADADLTVALDPGHGAGGLVSPEFFRRLGCEVFTVNAQPDGHFPGRDPEPVPENLDDLRRLVRAADADVGVAHDGDADRTDVVGPDGEVVHEDTVVAVLAADAVARSDAADPVVVTTPNASGRIDERVAAAGGRVERVRLGALHEGVAAAREAGGDVVYAAEPWKHVHPGLGGWIDGVATAAAFVRLVAAAAGDGDGDGTDGVAALRAPVTERPYEKRDVDCPDDAKAGAMARVTEALPAAFADADPAVDTDGGVRLSFPDASWVLVRPSGTEPYLRVYAESEDVGTVLDTTVAVVEDCVREG
jgi:phosphomannomutase